MMDRKKATVLPFHLIIDGEGIKLNYGNGIELFIAVATSLILSAFVKKRKKNHSSHKIEVVIHFAVVTLMSPAWGCY